MKLLFVSTLFLLLTGLPLATALISSGPLALAAAPMCSGLICAFAGMACLATGTGIRSWTIAFTLMGWVAAAVVAARRLTGPDGRAGPRAAEAGRSQWWAKLLRLRVGNGEASGDQPDGDALAARPQPRRRPLGWLPAGLVAALMLPVLAATTSPPVEWDARAIYWFHGLWFWQGGHAVAQAMGNPGFIWAHADYPPLYPAAAGALWTFYDPADRALAKALGSGLTFGAVLVIGLLLVTVAPRRLRWPTAVVAGLLGVGLFGIGHGNGTAGHVDLLWAAYYGAAVFALLLAPMKRDIVVIGVLSAIAAALTKNDAVPAVVLLIVLFAIRYRRRWRFGAAVLGILVPTLMWMALTQHYYYGQNDSFSASGIRGMLQGDPEYTSRFHPTITAMWHQVGPTVLASSAIIVFGALTLGRRRLRHRLGSWLWLPLSALGMAASFLLIYMTGPHDVNWWLFTSIDRTMIVVRVLLVIEVAVWLIVGLAAIAGIPTGRRRRSADAEVDAHADVDRMGTGPVPATSALTAGSAQPVT